MGEIILKLRRNLGLSQSELARRCSVTQQFIQRIEKGRAYPSIGTVVKLAAALDTTTDVILGQKAG